MDDGGNFSGKEGGKERRLWKINVTGSTMRRDRTPQAAEQKKKNFLILLWWA